MRCVVRCCACSSERSLILQAVAALKKDGLSVSGLVCHVGNEAHRAELINSTLAKCAAARAASADATQVRQDRHSGQQRGGEPLLWHAYDHAHRRLEQDHGGQRHRTLPSCPRGALIAYRLRLRAHVAQCAKHMIPRKKGSIVFIASIVGIRPDPLLGAYSGAHHLSRGFLGNNRAPGQRYRTRARTFTLYCTLLFVQKHVGSVSQPSL